MSGISLLCSLIGVSLALVIGTSTAADAQTTALRGARVIDGRGGAPIDNATIVIRDGRIVAVGPSAGTPVPSGAEVVDYAGKTIIPGLISDHSHVGIFVGLKATPENYNRDAILRQLKQLGRSECRHQQFEEDSRGVASRQEGGRTGRDVHALSNP